jgi:hypothetical protein
VEAYPFLQAAAVTWPKIADISFADVVGLWLPQMGVMSATLRVLLLLESRPQVAPRPVQMNFSPADGQGRHAMLTPITPISPADTRAPAWSTYILPSATWVDAWTGCLKCAPHR